MRVFFLAKAMAGFSLKVVGRLGTWSVGAVLALTACGPADPAVVQRAVQATLAAWPTATPVVVVVTVPVPVSATPEPPRPTSVEASPTARPTTAAPSPVPSLGASPTALPNPTTLAPTPLPQVTPGGDLLFSDDFSQNQVWNIGDLPDQMTSLQEGALQFSIKRADRFGILFNTSRRASNFEAVVHARPQTACATRDRYGLLFRVQDAANYYQFEVDCDGRYRLALIRAGILMPLQDWTSHPAIVPAGENGLYVRAAGNTIQLGVNNILVDTITEATLAEGGFGFYAGSGLRAGFTVFFDDLQVFEVK